MKKIILSLTFALSAVLMVCCSSPVPKGPETVAEKGGIKSYKVTDTAIDEDKAKVTVHLVYKDGTEDDQDMAFSKGEDGAWKQEIVGK